MKKQRGFVLLLPYFLVCILSYGTPLLVGVGAIAKYNNEKVGP